MSAHLVSGLITGIEMISGLIVSVVQMLVIASVLMSWVNADPGNPIVRMIQATTEPLYRPFRRITRRIPGPIDWAPLLLIFVVIFLQRVVVKEMLIPILRDMM